MSRTVEPFVIASNIPEYDDPLEHDLHNLKIALRIQQENVARTESQINEIEEMIELRKKKKEGVELE